MPNKDMCLTLHISEQKHVKDLLEKNKFKPKPFHIFLSGNGGIGKSYVIKTTLQALTKTLYRLNNPEKVPVILLSPTGVFAVNINGTTIHSGLGITGRGKYNKLGHKQKAYLRNKLSELKVINIDEISMVSGALFYQVY